MNNSTTTVILSERSLPAVAGESKDLYLPRLPRLSAPAGTSPKCFYLMKDNPTIAVILSERSESKDLYLPRLPRIPTRAGFSLCRLYPMLALQYEQPIYHHRHPERSESKDLYLPRLAPALAEAGFSRTSVNSPVAFVSPRPNAE